MSERGEIIKYPQIQAIKPFSQVSSSMEQSENYSSRLSTEGLGMKCNSPGRPKSRMNSAEIENSPPFSIANNHDNYRDASCLLSQLSAKNLYYLGMTLDALSPLCHWQPLKGIAYFKDRAWKLENLSYWKLSNYIYSSTHVSQYIILFSFYAC